MYRYPPTFAQIQSRDDIPGQGDIVALDAEFVSIAKEEAEIRSGPHKKATIKPAHMACARISAVYGSGMFAEAYNLWYWLCFALILITH